MKKQIAKIYKRREKAHEELLKCDVELDEILKGEKKEENIYKKIPLNLRGIIYKFMKIKTTQQKVNEALVKMKSVGSVSFDGTNGSFDVKGVEGRFMWDEPGTLTIILLMLNLGLLLTQ